MADPFNDVADLRAGLSACATLNGSVHVTDRAAFVGDVIDRLVRTAVFADDVPTRDAARWAIRSAGLSLGAIPASIQGLYQAVAAGEARGFTVPAHNIRGLTYDKARAIFRVAKELDAGAFIFEISNTEMVYCDLRPAEFTACVVAGAIKEGWRGPIFIQGDHFQYAAIDYFKEGGAAAETKRLKSLTREAVEAGYFNIDVDPSTLVVLDRPTVKEQQRDNFERAAEMTKFIRQIQPEGLEISVGGEIGEVGKDNSTVEEFEAFFSGYRESYLGTPVSKISVQSGAAHGGVVLADGSRQEVKIDFEVLRNITEACRRNGVAGAVQHGASTLPEELFDEFPKHDTVEIHLATEFQRIVFDHPRFPKELRARMEQWVRETRPKEWKDSNTDAQNWERCAKRTWGAFKKDIWNLPSDSHDAIVKSLEDKFRATFTRLNVKSTRDMVNERVKPVPVPPPRPAGF